jgi:hypothetical protein
MSPASSLVELSGPAPAPAREDIQVTRARVLETSAWIAYRPDRHEASRRRALSVGAVLDWDLLDTLMDLPAGLPVPLSALNPPACRRVASARAGVARVTDGQVIRDLVPALTPLLAVVVTANWDAGLVQASRFASYCRRMVLGPALPTGDHVMETAARLGIGVAVADGSRPGEVLLEPEPIEDWHPTTAWWRFCEMTWGQSTGAGAAAGQAGNDAQRSREGCGSRPSSFFSCARTTSWCLTAPPHTFRQ